MDLNDPALRAYLNQLNKLTGGDPSGQVSMYDVGQALGLDTDEAGQMAEALFIGGYAELKTLSGGIGITAMGMRELGINPEQHAADDSVTFSDETVMTDADRQVLESLMAEIKSSIEETTVDYSALDTLITDIKTIEVQMLSPQPKTAVVKALFTSICQTLPKNKFADLITRLETAVNS